MMMRMPLGRVWDSFRHPRCSYNHVALEKGKGTHSRSQKRALGLDVQHVSLDRQPADDL